ncbi:dTDP-4-dehydrorhamnose reductase [soil metagenome]|nr:dTDP-4-dehydrorhamnose reductase [Gemmatimonadales bacterium]
MRVLIAGADGQIGRALISGAPPHAQVRALGRARLDLTHPAEVAGIVREIRPDLVVNAAGYTAVDRAETEPETACAVNQEGTGHLAGAALEVGARMIHFSTDYVFDGNQGRPYLPDDRTNPLNVYGITKLAGEGAVLGALGERAAVIRTAWVYAAGGHNFVCTMLRLLGERERVTVVSDQIGTPTSAASVARAAWAVADSADLHGIVHWTDGGVASWYDFAVAIREEALEAGLLAHAAEVLPISTEAFAAHARRPRYSVLDCSATQGRLGMVPDHWRVALARTLRELVHA